MNHGEHGGNGEHGELKVCPNEIVDSVLTAATMAHRQLGPGLLESVYEHALMIELEEMGVPAR